MALMLLGAGGFAREVSLVWEQGKDSQEELFYLSDYTEQWDDYLPNGCVVGSIEKFKRDMIVRHPSLDRYIHKFIAAVGSPELKRKFVSRALKRFWEPRLPLIHPKSFIANLDIGNGSVVCSMCSITTNIRIGNHVSINLNCTIGHDTRIEDYVNLSPHCTISGNVHIKEGADLGSAVTVLPGVTIGKNSIIGAGAVILKDVPDNVVVVAKGVKGEVIKELK